VTGDVGQPFLVGASYWPRRKVMSWCAEGRLD
jgi:hypothetical protein